MEFGSRDLGICELSRSRGFGRVGVEEASKVLLLLLLRVLVRLLLALICRDSRRVRQEMEGMEVEVGKGRGRGVGSLGRSN